MLYLCFQPLISNEHTALKHTQRTHPTVSIPFLATFISAVLQFIIMAKICFFALIQIALIFLSFCLVTKSSALDVAGACLCRTRTWNFPWRLLNKWALKWFYHERTSPLNFVTSFSIMYLFHYYKVKWNIHIHNSLFLCHLFFPVLLILGSFVLLKRLWSFRASFLDWSIFLALKSQKMFFLVFIIKLFLTQSRDSCF